MTGPEGMNTFTAVAREGGIIGGKEKPMDDKRELNLRTDTKEYQTIGTPFVANAKMSARNVNIFYAEKHAIIDVSLDVGCNEVLAMIGPSGCGKSTFLRTLNRMNDIIPICKVQGQITLDNEDIYES